MQRIAPALNPQQDLLHCLENVGPVAFLGNTAKTSTPPPLHSREWLAETFLPSKLSLDYPGTDDARRVERFCLLNTSRSILPSSRTAHCCYSMTKGANGVPVVYSLKAKRANFRNLQTCASVWRCAVCAAKISEERRRALKRATGSFKAKTQGRVYLVTRTVPHGLNDPLPQTMAHFKVAEAAYKAGKGYNTIKTKFGYVGTVRNVEVTYGLNGWHPHIHELVFVTDSLDMEELKLSLHTKWAAACKKAGFAAPSWEHGVDVRDGDFAENYVSKFGLETYQWTASDELTKSHIKKAKGASVSPFDLLRIADQATDPNIVQFARARFAEFAKAFHGKRQLVVTPSLKPYFEEEEPEKTDEEIAADTHPDDGILATMTKFGWTKLRRLNRRGQMLEIARSNDPDRVKGYLLSLVPDSTIEELFLPDGEGRTKNIPRRFKTFDEHAIAAAMGRGAEEPCTTGPAVSDHINE